MAGYLNLEILFTLFLINLDLLPIQVIVSSLSLISILFGVISIIKTMSKTHPVKKNIATKSLSESLKVLKRIKMPNKRKIIRPTNI